VRLLIDANLSPALKHHLRNEFPGAIHVFDVGIEANDAAIWQYAHENSLLLLSKDSDFYHRAKREGDGPKIIWIRKRNCSTREIVSLMQRLDLVEFLSSKTLRCLIAA